MEEEALFAHPQVLHWIDLRVQELEILMGWDYYMLWDAVWLDDCDALLLIAESKGSMLEYERAKEEGKMLFQSIDKIQAVERGVCWADRHIV